MFGATFKSAASAYSPITLFNQRQPGFWYDPSDLTTLFQDAAGTTPVTAAGQSVGLVLDKSRGLVLGPELVANGDFSGGTTGWTAARSATLSVSAGALVISYGGVDYPQAQQAITTAVGSRYKIVVTQLSGVNLSVVAGNAAGGNQLGSLAGKGLLTLQFVATSTTTYITLQANAVGAVSVTLDNISVRELPGNHATQSTSLSRPTYQIDSAERGYLSFDGSDDFLITPTITPGTDKAQVFARVRKLSDAARGMVVEFGTGTTGGVSLNAPAMNATANYRFSSAGSLQVDATTASVFPSPITGVLTGIGDIAGDVSTLRVNGVQAATSTADQGTGNYLAYPAYIGRRGGTSLPFNGRIYSLICRFGPNLTAEQITQTEAWVNSKTGAY